MESDDVINAAWDNFEKYDFENVHKQCGEGVEAVLRTSVAKKTLDNITAFIVAFDNYEKVYRNKMRSSNLNSS